LSFSKEAKVEIAKILDELGVERIEAGMPIVSVEDKKAVELILAAGLKAEIWGFCRCRREDIDACLEVGVKRVVIESPTSPYKMKAYNFSQERVLNMVRENLLYAKERNLYSAYFAVDASRSELGFLEQVYRKAVTEGRADEVVAVDTLGVANPEAMAFLVERIKGWVDVPVMVHCHNDFGLGTACTLAAVKAGAEWAHVTVNGLGEKTGNTDIAELAVAAKLLYGYELDIRLDKLYDAARKVEKISGIRLSPLKPVVGANVFKRESGVVVSQLAKYPPAVEGYSPELVGRSRQVILGKMSGRSSVEYMLDQLNIQGASHRVDEIMADLKNLALKKKGPVSQKEFRSLVKEVMERDGS
jgi:isopropylmalate/homocitrate/citramalate synthase